MILFHTECNTHLQKLLTLSDKEVEQGNDHSVSAEHVVPTCVHSCQGHPEPAPDRHRSLQLGPHVTVHLDGEKKSSALWSFKEAEK